MSQNQILLTDFVEFYFFLILYMCLKKILVVIFLSLLLVIFDYLFACMCTPRTALYIFLCCHLSCCILCLFVP